MTTEITAAATTRTAETGRPEWRLQRPGARLGGGGLGAGTLGAISDQFTGGRTGAEGDADVIARYGEGTPTRYLARPEGRIAYDDRGRGPLVVAAPSMGDLRGEYRFLAPRLVAAGYRVVTMDVRGHGESDTSFTGYAPEDVGTDIVALIEALEAGPAVVIGASMAAGAAAWAAAKRPALVRALVMIGPFVRVLPVPLIQRLMLKALMRRPWGAAAWSRYYASLYPTSPPADLVEYRADLRANLKEPGRFRALQRMLAASKGVVEARLGEVAAPTLVLMGTADPDFPDPAAEAEVVGARLRGTVGLIEGAGHYPHAEMPEVTFAQIEAFLARTAPAHASER